MGPNSCPICNGTIPCLKHGGFVPSYSCDHPMIQRGEDGGTYCTECKQRVA